MYHLVHDHEVVSWDKCNGALTNKINRIIKKFIVALVIRDNIPYHSMLIVQTSIWEGGLSLIYPNHRAAPDVVLTMVTLARYACQSLVFTHGLFSVDATWLTVTNS